MNKIAVVYKSKYGSTKKYAQWIANEVNGDLIEFSEAKIENIIAYDIIIFGGGLYAKSLNGVSIITKNYEKLKGKNLIIFAVGLTPADNEEALKIVTEQNLTEEMRSEVKYFYLRGGMDYNKLSFLHKSMMAMIKKIISKKKAEEMSDLDKMILDTYGGKVDFINKDTIEPIVTYVKSIL